MCKVSKYKLHIFVFLCILFGIWSNYGVSANRFQQIMSSRVTYVELAGRRTKDLSGFEHFGIVVHTVKPELWLIHYVKRITITYIRYMSTRWMIVTAWQASYATVYTFYRRGDILFNISDVATAVKKVEKMAGIILPSSEWVKHEAYNSVKWSYRQNHFKTWNSCLAHNIRRRRTFKTTPLFIAGVQKVTIDVAYVIRQCEVVRYGCSGQMQIFLLRFDDRKAFETISWNNTHQDVEDIGVLEDIGNQNYKRLVSVKHTQNIALKVEETGVCGQIYNISVTYFICPSRQENITYYRKAFAPYNGSSEHTGFCSENARPKANHSLVWKCNSAGIATYSDGCICEDGFREKGGKCIVHREVINVDTDKKNKQNSEERIKEENKKGDKETKQRTIFLSIGIPVGVVLVLLLAVFLLRKKRFADKNKALRLLPVTADTEDGTVTYIPGFGKLSDRETIKLAKHGEFDTESRSPPYIDPYVIKPVDYPVYQNIDHYEYPPENLKFTGDLGKGNFGTVHFAEALNISGWTGVSNVAVKTLKESAKEEYGEAFLFELDLLRCLKPHENIVRLLGCCTVNGPTHIIFEYMENGDLQTFVRKCVKKDEAGREVSTLPLMELLSFARMISNGMEHLEKHRIVHRDLACRNILVDHNLVCKVSDFGLARYVDEVDTYQKGPQPAQLPVQWMAPESIFKGTYSFKSDVWSFGVLLWELFSCGDKPYPGYSNIEMLQSIREGQRMKIPPNCPKEMYQVMLLCWDEEPKNRPPFSELTEVFKSNELWNDV